jgi:hypothetical protein
MSFFGLTVTGVNKSEPASATSDNCIVRDAAGNQQWTGEPGAELVQLGTKLQEIVDDHKDQATAVVYCSDYQGALVMLPASDLSVEPLVTAAAAQYPSLSIRIVPVWYALAPLLKLASAIFSDSALQGIVTGGGPDAYTGGIRLSLSPTAAMSPDVLTSTVNALADSIVGADVPISTEVQGVGQFADRFADTPPYWMGDELDFTVNSNSYYCSSGVPLHYGGTSMLLTAGHCTGTSFYNGGNFVGSTYTTSYIANTYGYGDWKLVDGSTYAPYVFSGSTSTDTSSLVIDGANWGGLPVGSAVCTSGRTTYQVCRYYVTEAYDTATFKSDIDGKIEDVYPLLRMRHQSSGGGGGDSNGFQPGIQAVRVITQTVSVA